MACINCGKDRPVLKDLTGAKQRFNGMCRPCAEKEMRMFQQDAADKIKGFFGKLFN